MKKIEIVIIFLIVFIVIATFCIKMKFIMDESKNATSETETSSNIKKVTERETKTPTQTGAQELVLQNGHVETVKTVAFSPDGRTLA